MNRRLLIAGLAAGIAATAGLFGGALAGGSGAQDAPTAGTGDTARVLLQGFSAGDTAATIARLEQRVGAAPEDSEGLALLGLAYQQRARETGDPSFYPRSEEALDRSLGLRLTTTSPSGLAALAAPSPPLRGIAAARAARPRLEPVLGGGPRRARLRARRARRYEAAFGRSIA